MVSRDATERGKLPEKIWLDEKSYRDLLESLAEGIWRLDKHDVTAYVNSQMAKMLGYSPKEMLGKPLFSFMDEHGRAIERAARARRGRGLSEHLDHEFIRKNGSRLFALVETSTLSDEKGKFVGTISCVLDTTERRRIERTLFASEKKYRSLFANMKSGFAYFQVLVGRNGKPLDYALEEANDAFRKITNLTSQAILGRTMSELHLLRENFPELTRVLGEAATTGKNTEFEGYVAGFDKWLRVSAYRPETGYCAAVLDDETEMKRAQQQIESAAKFPEENPDPILRITRDGIIIYCNPAASKLLNLWKRRVGEPAPNRWCRIILEALNTRRRTELEEEYGAETFSFLFSPVTDYVNIYGHNITDRKELEGKLKRSERLAGIGQTAAMVGHDLRNPLQAIVGYVALAQEKLKRISCQPEEKQSLNDSLKDINKTSYYMDKIVSDLQDYARPLKPALAKKDVKELVDETVSLLQIPPEISFSIKVPKNLPRANVDPMMLRRVLTNLINNSLQAMPKGGKLSLNILSKKQPHSLMIKVKDTGSGISKADRPRIFAPLFTTKSTGQGLGLAVSKRLVEAQGGTISFRSRPSTGTIFTITIPLETHDGSPDEKSPDEHAHP